MLVRFVRKAIEAQGAEPKSFAPIEALRELVAAYGGTPTKYDRLGLWREAIAALGGTPTQNSERALIKELVATRGGTPDNRWWNLLGQLSESFEPPTEAPANTSLPVISGTPTVGETLSATNGSWSNSPTSYARQWYADGVAISGATGLTLALTEALEGAEITFGVVATNVVGLSEEALSEAVGPVEGEPVEPVFPGDINDLTATAQSAAEILLEWTPASDATGHQYRIGSGEWTAAGNGSQLVAGLTAETAYTFQVRGTNAEGPGNASNVASETTEAEPAEPTEFYKTATITGAVPAGHPISLQAWQHKPAVTEFGTPTVLATDVGAMQGVAQGGGFYFTSSGTSASPANNRQIRTYNSSWALQHTRDTALDLGGHAQVNGLFVDGSKLYAGANNHNTQPSAGWVLEYNIEANGSLTFVAAHSIGNMWTEGCAKHDGSWFVVGHDRHEIWQFDLSWNLIEVHSLPGTSPGDASGNLYQGIRFIGDVALLNLHGSNANSPRMDTYKWTGEGFAEALLNIKPPTDCTQGFHITDDGLTMLWARRNSNGSMNPADVVSTPIINVTEGVDLEGRALADFSDVRVTNAAGAEIPVWVEHYFDDRMAFLHFANPATIASTADFRVYYGSGVPATRTDALGIGAIKFEDFESGRGAFVNNYNAGNATTVAGAGLNGSAALSVTGTAGDGVYSNSGEFMRPSLVRLVGWIKPASGVLGEVHLMAPTGSGSNQRRGNLQFNNTSVQARSNNVVQPAFASGLAPLTWRRYEIEFDFAASRYGAKIFDESGVRRGHAPRSTYQTVDSAPVYRDVMPFRQQHADRIFTLPMLATEPAWGAWSAETAA